jgi:hypothetical protein
MILIGFVQFVFQPSHFALVKETIHGDHEVCVTVAVKIARFDIRHPANLVQEDHWGKSQRAVIGQQHHTSHQIVGRFQRSEAADNNVACQPACRPYLRMCGIADRRERSSPRLHSGCEQVTADFSLSHTERLASRPGRGQQFERAPGTDDHESRRWPDYPKRFARILAVIQADPDRPPAAVESPG